MKAYAAVMGKLGELSVSHSFLHGMSFVLLTSGMQKLGKLHEVLFRCN